MRLTPEATPIQSHVARQSQEQLLRLWLYGRSPGTEIVYKAESKRLFTFVNDKPLCEITLADLQLFAESLKTRLAPASVQRSLAAVKSLFGFAARLGYLPFDTARPLRLPPLRNRLAERI